MSNTSAYYRCTSIYGGVCPITFGAVESCLVREDTLAGVVYYRIDGLSVDTLEHVLYNYNLRVGDSIIYQTLIDTVESIDSTIVNGVYHKIFNFQNTVYGRMRTYTVLEGIGCTNNPLLPVFFGACFEYGESLVCFSQNGIWPAAHAPINSCAAFGTICCSISVGVFDNVIGCSGALGSPVPQKEIKEVRISPNPANDIIEVTNGYNDGLSVSLVDLTGISKKMVQIAPGKKQINISGLPPGLYIATISSSGAVVYREKLQIYH